MFRWGSSGYAVMMRLARMVLLMTLLALSGCAGKQPVMSDVLLPDLAGASVRPLQSGLNAATVIIFTTTDCPIANSYAPEINAIAERYSTRGVGIYLVHVDPRLTTDAARRHAREYSLRAPVLIDREHTLVKALGAKVTPEAAVVGPSGDLLYRGRIDDRYVDFGKRRLEPSQRDLRDAIEAVLQGKPVAHPRTNAVGCFISSK